MQMQIVTSDAMKAARRNPCSETSTTSPSTNTISDVATAGSAGRGTDCAWCRSAPRAPRRRAYNVMATKMMRNGSPSERPCFGSQLQTVWSLTSSDCTMPSPRPAPAVIQNDWNRPISTAPSAGTTNSVYDVGSSDEIGVISTPDRREKLAMIQLRAAIDGPEMPRRAAPTSFSAPARVASPKCVHW